MSTTSSPGEARNTVASARVVDSTTRKRAGEVLDAEEIAGVVADFVHDRIPDYQMAAWLATIACTGLSTGELVALTRAYAMDGGHLDLSRVDGAVVDKHSTGGVGDTTTLIVVPVVAACGAPVAKMTGRALGFTGGTLDKLESIKGLRTSLPVEEIVPVLKSVGMVITGQSTDLTPGDGATYALRDVTGTVESIPLIAASIISKKFAVQADGLVLDVKTGSGALIRERHRAVELIQTMLDLARVFGLSARAVLSDMSQPLGPSVGNALEIRQALAVLRGERTPGLWDLCVTVCRQMLQSVDPLLTDEQAMAKIDRVLDDGSAYEMFVRWAVAQGAAAAALEAERFPTASNRYVVKAAESGWVTGIDPRVVGKAGLLVGAGRLTYDAPLDYGAGILLRHRVGDHVDKGDVLAELFYDRGDADTARSLVESAFRLGDRAVTAPSAVQQVFDPRGA
ncbi:thymidine phosphorylase [Streptomyces sp. NEAU-W12]|uniref:thymidine phosphorylase n=1 Tax=Streptomyces sp. NEAU-W12 TaxID=2994668 RepID=UPI00224B2759|nr:thymidine phosphorylase [Streptomyces sp. NEAU-W12]MCX2926047.1 thymidine phosphorylase [Streptomyces sp. NEAU-W12]